MSGGKHFMKPSIKVLRMVADGLEEINSLFPWEGIAGTEDRTEDEESPLSEDNDAAEDTTETDDDIYEESYYTAGFDREDVEIAIDAFLSHLFRKRLIRKNKSGHLPSFAGVFRKLFGDHPICKTADNFETNIKGYFGWISYENMKSAYAEFLEIQAFVKKELEALNRVENKRLFDTNDPRTN